MEMVVTGEDFTHALDTLTEAEEFMPEIFLEMSTSTHSQAIEETFFYVMRRERKTDKPVPESAVVNFLARRVPANMIGFTLDAMIKSGKLVADEKYKGANMRRLTAGKLDEDDY